jgi:CTP synthase
VRIAVVGKYTALHDAYKSVGEALLHGGIGHNVGVDIRWIDSDLFAAPDADPAALLDGFDGLLVPGGFGDRGIEGMIAAIRHARTTRLPFFGICLGMQVAIIEFARDVAGMTGTTSTEFEPDCPDPVIALMASQRDVKDLGGTMRLGAYAARLREGSKAAQAYGTTEISERHRHRWEVNNAFRHVLAEHGMRLSGLSPDGSLVEMMELPDHPWFVGCQFHPELKSRPTRPHPLFAAFIGAAVERARPSVGAPADRVGATR